ncbi:MAG: riboflavin biosynthesis protein RibF [Oscillospiraceae bacterium]|nr:riboflavin biosynthesis protein RibF [Oscillospiraceae bacterium]
MKRVVALGFFDGVHIGHGRLLQKTLIRAEQIGGIASALTFENHPMALIHGNPLPLLCSGEERLRMIKVHYKIPEVIFMPFDRTLRKLPWQLYIEDILIGQMNAAHVVAGHDFTFGHNGEGTPELLQERCQMLEVGCDIIPPQCLHGVRVSSTYIRELIGKGEVELAAGFLGRHYSLPGVVTQGRGKGREMGFPTANILLPPERQHPAFGVYATRVSFNGGVYPAVTNVGLRPTFENESQPVIESFLLDWQGDLYGRRIDVSFLRFLRGEQKFPNIQALKAQIAKDIAQSR